MQTTTDTSSPATLHHPEPARVGKALAKRSFATIATVSGKGRPHVAGVIYEFIDDVMYVSTLRSSRKARNIESNTDVAIVVPVRRLPVGPPSTVQFQASAVVLDSDDAEIRQLVEQGHLKSITGHGELDLADGCFLRISVPSRVLTYGLGMPLRRLIADPLNGGRIVER